jgi:hypothetical protein
MKKIFLFDKLLIVPLQICNFFFEKKVVSYENVTNLQIRGLADFLG